MKEYKEENFGIEYHVIEYDIEDTKNLNIIYEIFNANLNSKYLKIIEKTESNDIINYYLDGMKHNDFGPATFSTDENNKKEKYYVLNKKIENKKEFTSWKRTKMIDNMLNE